MLDYNSSMQVLMNSGTVQSGFSISSAVATQENNFKTNSSDTDVSICVQPQQHTLPGTNSVPDAEFNVCYTVTASNGQSVPLIADICDSVVQVNGSNLLLVFAAFLPQSAIKADGAALQQVTPTAQWLQLPKSA